MDGRPNRTNKAAFSNFSGVEWTLPNWFLDLDSCMFELI